jgi:hypothetical protein
MITLITIVLLIGTHVAAFIAGAKNARRVDLLKQAVTK